MSSNRADVKRSMPDQERVLSSKPQGFSALGDSYEAQLADIVKQRTALALSTGVHLDLHFSNAKLHRRVSEKIKTLQHDEILAKLDNYTWRLKCAIEHNGKYNARQVSSVAGSGGFKGLDEKEIALLKGQAKQLCDAYKAAAADLTHETRHAYLDIESKRLLVYQNIKQQINRLDQYNQKLDVKLKRFDEDKTSEAAQGVVEAYNEFDRYINAADEAISTYIIKSDAIVVKYQQLDKAYDSGRSKLIDTCKFEFEQLIPDLKLVVAQSRGHLQKAKADARACSDKLAMDALSAIISNAILNQIGYWHEQIDSFWGSWDKVELRGKDNNQPVQVSVANGIMKMYNYLVRNADASPEEKLNQLQKIASERKKTGMGFFAKRRTTTQQFYEVISDIDVDNKNPQKLLSEVKAKLSQINQEFILGGEAINRPSTLSPAYRP